MWLQKSRAEAAAATDAQSDTQNTESTNSSAEFGDITRTDTVTDSVHELEQNMGDLQFTATKVTA